MNKPIQLRFRPPPGVSFTQWTDGTIVFSYSKETLMPLRAALATAASELVRTALELKEAERLEEIERRKLPKTPMEVLDDEIQELRALADQGDPDAVPDMEEIPSTLDS